MECEICLAHSNTGPNKIARCVECEISVHQICYGGNLLRGITHQWKCEKCLYLEIFPHATVKCLFCPVLEGAIKLVKQGISPIIREGEVWAHVQCVNWNRAMYFANDILKENINTDNLRKKDIHARCSICSVENGCCIPCHYTGCSNCFHVTCAQNSKLITNWYEMQVPLEKKQRFGDTPNYCKEHNKGERRPEREFGIDNMREYSGEEERGKVEEYIEIESISSINCSSMSEESNEEMNMKDIDCGIKERENIKGVERIGEEIMGSNEDIMNMKDKEIMESNEEMNMKDIGRATMNISNKEDVEKGSPESNVIADIVDEENIEPTLYRESKWEGIFTPQVLLSEYKGNDNTSPISPIYDTYDIHKSTALQPVLRQTHTHNISPQQILDDQLNEPSSNSSVIRIDVKALKVMSPSPSVNVTLHSAQNSLMEHINEPEEMALPQHNVSLSTSSNATSPTQSAISHKTPHHDEEFLELQELANDIQFMEPESDEINNSSSQHNETRMMYIWKEDIKTTLKLKYTCCSTSDDLFQEFFQICQKSGIYNTTTEFFDSQRLFRKESERKAYLDGHCKKNRFIGLEEMRGICSKWMDVDEMNLVDHEEIFRESMNNRRMAGIGRLNERRRSRREESMEISIIPLDDLPPIRKKGEIESSRQERPKSPLNNIHSKESSPPQTAKLVLKPAIILNSKIEEEEEKEEKLATGKLATQSHIQGKTLEISQTHLPKTLTNAETCQNTLETRNTQLPKLTTIDKEEKLASLYSISFDFYSSSIQLHNQLFDLPIPSL